jgi:Ser/Thr protein kinase RdoA (MazF antagonist)
MHLVGASRPFAHRGRLDTDTYGRDPRDFLLEEDWLPPAALPRWRTAISTALDEVQRAFDSLPELRTLRLHGDCHPGNILWSDEGPHFVDLDDALTGPATQDLWMLLSGDRASMTRRMIHHSAWIARRWNDPAFPVAFPWFNGAAYWQQQTTQLTEQIDAMREAPLGTPPR